MNVLAMSVCDKSISHVGQLGTSFGDLSPLGETSDTSFTTALAQVFFSSAGMRYRVTARFHQRITHQAGNGTIALQGFRQRLGELLGQVLAPVNQPV